VFLVVIFFQGFKVTLKLANNKTTSDASYPIRLFYTSNMPIILMSALVSNVYFFSQMLYRNFRGNFITSIFGTWQEAGYQGQIVPVGGLIYYITSPKTFYDAITQPIHTIVYTLFVVGSNYIFIKVVLFSVKLGLASQDKDLDKYQTILNNKECQLKDTQMKEHIKN